MVFISNAQTTEELRQSEAAQAIRDNERWAPRLAEAKQMLFKSLNEFLQVVQPDDGKIKSEETPQCVDKVLERMTIIVENRTFGATSNERLANGLTMMAQEIDATRQRVEANKASSVFQPYTRADFNYVINQAMIVGLTSGAQVSVSGQPPTLDGCFGMGARR